MQNTLERGEKENKKASVILKHTHTNTFYCPYLGSLFTLEQLSTFRRSIVIFKLVHKITIIGELIDLFQVFHEYLHLNGRLDHLPNAILEAFCTFFCNT